MKVAAQVQGAAQARVNLPEWPADCRVKEVHAPVSVGLEVRSVLKRERGALDRQNSRTDRCSGFYDNLAKEMR